MLDIKLMLRLRGIGLLIEYIIHTHKNSKTNPSSEIAQIIIDKSKSSNIKTSDIFAYLLKDIKSFKKYSNKVKTLLYFE